ncbi:hypothetical protein Anapl_06719 [Anas platyrhynchos]|uniref:Uncharacterized protein n=1 Tax=Anas platyrhynchos TaxID=8839 RepID=R0KAB1_ANAPL|nr:hypothetical protein Anapl_06719 [Anas platyrhynchos]
MMSQSEQIFGTSYCPRQLLPRDKGVIMGCRKRAVRDCKRGTMACLGKELKIKPEKYTGAQIYSDGDMLAFTPNDTVIQKKIICLNRVLNSLVYQIRSMYSRCLEKDIYNLSKRSDKYGTFEKNTEKNKKKAQSLYNATSKESLNRQWYLNIESLEGGCDIRCQKGQLAEEEAYV